MDWTLKVSNPSSVLHDELKAEVDDTQQLSVDSVLQCLRIFVILPKASTIPTILTNVLHILKQEMFLSPVWH